MKHVVTALVLVLWGAGGNLAQATINCGWSFSVFPANEDAGFPGVQGHRTTDGVWVNLVVSAPVGTSAPAPVGYDAFRLHWGGGSLLAGHYVFTTTCGGHTRTKTVDWPDRSAVAPEFNKAFDLYCESGCGCAVWAAEDHDCDGTPDECDPDYEDCDNNDIACDRCDDANGNHLCDPPHTNPQTGQPCENCGPDTDDLDCDGVPNDQDPDIDGDGIPNVDDPDMDGDGIPNLEDPDVDGDGVPNDDDPEPCGPGSDPCTCLDPPPDGCDDEPCENSFIDHDCDGIPNGCDREYVGSCPDSNGNGICDHCECDPSDPDYPDCAGDPCADPPANDHDCDGVPNECDKDYDAPGCLDANGDKICDHCQGTLPPTGPDPELELPTAPQVDWDVPSLDLSGEAYEYDINLPWVDGGSKQLHVSTDPSDWGSSGLVAQLPMPSLLWYSMNQVRQLVRLMMLVMVIWAFGVRFLRLFHTT